jgi:hypothetical protein
LRQWEILEYIDPWGQRRDDHRAARLAQSFGVKGGFSQILEMFDFGPKAEQTEAESEAVLEAAATR